MKLCECGCGKPTKVSTRTDRSNGIFKGVPFRFCIGHHPLRPIGERFWEHVDKTDNCWIWTGSINDSGYGMLTVRSKPDRAHRISWRLHNGDIPEGLILCHSCDNRRCVNPDHLFLGTDADNMRDKVNKKRHHWGESTPSSKLTVSDVVNIRRIYSLGGVSQKALSERFGVSQPAIQGIISGRLWRSCL